MRRNRYFRHCIEVSSKNLGAGRHILGAIDTGTPACVIHCPPLAAFTKKHGFPTLIVDRDWLPAVIGCVRLESPESITRNRWILFYGYNNVA